MCTCHNLKLDVRSVVCSEMSWHSMYLVHEDNAIINLN